MAEYLGYPFDPEVFDYNWKNETDPVLTAILESGALQNNEEIKGLVSRGSDTYTIPFYKTIGGEPDNYDGQTNINSSEPAGSAQSGVVYGRAHGWTAKDFVFDFNSGADPMQQITSQVGKFWLKYRQKKMIDILNAVFGVVGSGEFKDWENHKIATGAAPTATDISDALTAALGDARGNVSLAIMHSHVANELEDLNLLNFRKYTDASGIERQLNIADINGLTVVVDDGTPTAPADSDGQAGVYTVTVSGTWAAGDTITINGITYTVNATDGTTAANIVGALDDLTISGYALTSSGAVLTCTEASGSYGKVGAPRVAVNSKAGKVAVAVTTEGIVVSSTLRYTTYLLGVGSLLYAPASVKTPSEVARDAAKNGGEDTLYTRVRETIHPNGFTFIKPAGYTSSPTNAALAASANWGIVGNPKNINMVKLETL